MISWSNIMVEVKNKLRKKSPTGYQKMFKPLRVSAIEEMVEVGSITIGIKNGWETTAPSVWNSLPGNITYWLAGRPEHIFKCYYTRDANTLQLTNLEATELISDKKALVDAYLFVALKGLIESIDTMKLKRLIIDSRIPSVVDHMLDLGFSITPRGSFGEAGGRGYKVLGD